MTSYRDISGGMIVSAPNGRRWETRHFVTYHLTGQLEFHESSRPETTRLFLLVLSVSGTRLK